MTQLDECRALLETNRLTLTVFLRHCVGDVGLNVQLLKLSNSEKTLFDSENDQAEFPPSRLYQMARDDVKNGLSEANKDYIQAAILAAPSLEYLVWRFDQLRQQRPDIIPESRIPDRDVVDAALQLFYDNLEQRVYAEITNPQKSSSAVVLPEEDG